MKKIFTIIIVAGSFTACSGNGDSAATVSATDSAKGMIDSAKNTIKVAADTTNANADTTKSK